MKKTSKLFGAVACSAALALGCAVPAFAADPAAGVNPGSEEAQKFQVQSNGTATNGTTVDVLYKADQINASVPLQATIVASGDANTADAIMAPEKESYKITNNSLTKGIKVSGVKSESLTNSAWELGTIADKKPANNNNPKGLLDLTLTGYSNGGTTAGKTINLSDSSTGALDPATPVNAEWQADKSTETAKSEIYLQLDGYSLPNGQVVNDAGSKTDKTLKTEAVFKVTYTLSIA